jgi:soluble lytic murein transglycosylase
MPVWRFQSPDLGRTPLEVKPPPSRNRGDDDWLLVGTMLRIRFRATVRPALALQPLLLGTLLLGVTPSVAQSRALLETVRLHRPEARALAVAELETCRQAQCNRMSSLSLLVGYLTLSEGNAEDAVKLLATLPPPDELAPVHAYYLGQAYFYAGRPLDAARQFEAAMQKAPRWLEPRLRARLGEALLAAGQGVQAAPHLEKAAMAAGTPELYFQRAQGRRAVGNLDGERADLTTLAIRFPTHAYGVKALELLRSDKKKPLKWGFEELWNRARALDAAEEPELALEQLRAAEQEKLVKGPQLEARVAFMTASLLFDLKKNKEADAKLEAIIKKGPSSFSAEALLYRARRALKAKDNAAAREQMAIIAEKFPKEAAAEESLFFVGWLSLQLGKYSDALTAFDAFEKRYTRSKRRDDVLWFKALALARQEQFPAAKDAAENLMKQYPRSLLVPQAQYWSNRWNQQAKAPNEPVIKAYESIIKNSPGSFYAILSVERLIELGQKPPPLFDVRPKLPEGVALPEQLKLASALSTLGLFRDAAEEISLRLSSVRTSDQAVKLGAALQHMGEYGAAHQLAARYLWGQAYTSKDPAALALLYPQAFADTLRPVAEQHKVDPYLMWAIMRRESAFRTDVMSGADARGLMQLIPPTGIAVARELGIPVPEPADLFAPELNIRLAGWYISALYKRFGHPVLCAAAYNAGPPAALKWVDERGQLPMDAFVEEIPFRETRAYIKQVVADQHIYRALYEPTQEPLRLNLTVPKPSATGVGF